MPALLQLVLQWLLFLLVCLCLVLSLWSWVLIWSIVMLVLVLWFSLVAVVARFVVAFRSVRSVGGGSGGSGVVFASVVVVFVLVNVV